MGNLGKSFGYRYNKLCIKQDKVDKSFCFVQINQLYPLVTITLNDSTTDITMIIIKLKDKNALLFVVFWLINGYFGHFNNKGKPKYVGMTQVTWFTRYCWCQSSCVQLKCRRSKFVNCKKVTLLLHNLLNSYSN